MDINERLYLIGLRKQANAKARKSASNAEDLMDAAHRDRAIGGLAAFGTGIAANAPAAQAKAARYGKKLFKNKALLKKLRRSAEIRKGVAGAGVATAAGLGLKNLINSVRANYKLRDAAKAKHGKNWKEREKKLEGGSVTRHPLASSLNPFVSYKRRRAIKRLRQ